jgi:hypothetical protein
MLLTLNERVVADLGL